MKKIYFINSVNIFIGLKNELFGCFKIEKNVTKKMNQVCKREKK